MGGGKDIFQSILYKSVCFMWFSSLTHKIFNEEVSFILSSFVLNFRRVLIFVGNSNDL